MKDRLLTGLQPSGNLTIGNYCGGIKQIIDYQNDYDAFLFVPDLHAITVKHDPVLLRKRIRDVVTLYLACGVDPDKCHIYIQSENLYHANLSWILECHSYIGELSRMTQFKAKNASEESTTCGLFTYPVLMAADILLYSAKYVPTCADQKQHLELARNIATRFNQRYGEVFLVPEPLIPKTGAKIRDLQDPELKMSKSCANPKGAIFLNDDPKTIRKKIMAAKTDSDCNVKFDETIKPGISNLLTIYTAFTEGDLIETEKHFVGNSYGELKTQTADVVIEKLQQVQAKYQHIDAMHIVDDILDQGRNYTQGIAKMMYEKVSQIVGLGRQRL